MTKYELDHMPETAAGKRMYARVSPVYENSLFMKRFYDALGAKWDKLREFFTSLREQHFIDTVDWGIEFLEHRYSLEPRPDLTLEERRARLGIKARTHRPLNPAVMERHIRDEFELETYLSEDEPGYIHLIANWLSPTGWQKMIPWLVKEKPAHLVLKATQHLVSYTGTNPDESFERPRVILPGALPLPKTLAEKKQYPRLFVGGAIATSGVVNVDLPRPKDSITRPRVGNALLTSGAVTINLRRLKSSKVCLRVGCPLVILEQVFIGSKSQPLRIKENPIADLAIANVAISRS